MRAFRFAPQGSHQLPLQRGQRRFSTAVPGSGMRDITALMSSKFSTSGNTAYDTGSTTGPSTSALVSRHPQHGPHSHRQGNGGSSGVDQRMNTGTTPPSG